MIEKIENHKGQIPDNRQLAINTLEVVISNCPDIFPGDLLEIKETLKKLQEGGKFSPRDITIMSKNALMDQCGMDILESDSQFLEVLSNLLHEKNGPVIEEG